MIRLFLFCLLFALGTAEAAPRELGDHRWADVERIVAIGDLHGDPAYRAHLVKVMTRRAVASA